MYYVLFETGNEGFFSRIADAWCTIVVKRVIEFYKDIKSAHPDQLMPDMKYINKELKKHEEIFKLLNCALFPDLRCKNQKCSAGNTAVLTTNQLDVFEVSMTNVMHANLVAKSHLWKTKDRLIIQKTLQNFPNTFMQDDVKCIPIEYNRQYHDEYLRSYIMKTDRLKDKAESFVYVRAKTDSDYDYFMANTRLPNVMPCDCFQY